MRVQLWTPGLTGFGGGIRAFSAELARGLRDLGHAVVCGGLVDVPGDWEGLRLFGGGDVPGWWRRAGFAGRCTAHAWLDRPDLIIGTHVHLGPLVWGLGAGCRARTLLVAHGVDVHPGLSPARRLALRRVDQRLAVSGWTRARVLALPGMAGRGVGVLPNTFDEGRFRVGGPPTGLRARLGIAPGERVILTVARLAAHEGYKGYDRLVAALPLVREACGAVSLVVVGEGADAARVRALAAAQGLAGQVRLVGFVADDELADYYRLADVFAMPSTGEGFGIVFLEALACGTPVLAGNRDGSVDALDGGRLGMLVDPLAVAAIAAGLVRLLRGEGPADWFDRARLGQAVKARFGRQAFRERLRAVLTMRACDEPDPGTR